MKNARIPHPGNVKTHVSTISFTIFQFTADARFEKPTPIMEEVFVWVVLTGIPVKDAVSKHRAAPVSAAKP